MFTSRVVIAVLLVAPLATCNPNPGFFSDMMNIAKSAVGAGSTLFTNGINAGAAFANGMITTGTTGLNDGVAAGATFINDLAKLVPSVLGLVTNPLDLLGKIIDQFISLLASFLPQGANGDCISDFFNQVIQPVLDAVGNGTTPKLNTTAANAAADGLQTCFSSVAKDVVDAIKTVTETVVGAILALPLPFIPGNIGDLITAFSNALIGVLQTGGAAVQGFVTALTELATTILSGVSGVAQTGINAAASVANATVSGANSTATAAANGTASTVNGAASAVNSTVSG